MHYEMNAAQSFGVCEIILKKSILCWKDLQVHNCFMEKFLLKSTMVQIFVGIQRAKCIFSVTLKNTML